MKFSVSILLALATAVVSETVYVTQTHITTINGEQATTIVAYLSPAGAGAGAEKQAAAPAPQPTTPVTKEAKAATTSADATAAETSASSSDDAIYADISKSPDLDSTFAKNVLDAHNEKRALHHAGPLSWDKDVYEYAQAYADKYDCSGTLTHSGGKYGENLAVGYASGVDALGAWYDEGDNYDYNSGSYNHFTQVVWKGSHKLGCAIKDCSAKNWGHYVICSYDPAGNFIGDFKENVLPE